VADVLTPHEAEAAASLKKAMDSRVFLHFGLFEAQEKMVGWSSSYQLIPSELLMMNSAAFPEYRRQGHYSTMIKKTLERAAELGFQTVSSKHVCTNNSVIIAKLKAGFKLTGFEISTNTEHW